MKLNSGLTESKADSTQRDTRHTCQCSDPGCPSCEGACRNLSNITLYRIDMVDETGTDFCDHCAEDAYESGVFADQSDIEENDEYIKCEISA